MLAPLTSRAMPIRPYMDVPFPIQTHPGTVNESQHMEYDKRALILDIQRKEVEDYMDKVIKQATNTSNFLTSRDYEKFGLLPGQQIAYAGGFGLSSLTHHGIYIGNGIVAEVASQSCLRKCLLNAYNFNTLCFGLSTMADFAKRATEKNSPVYLFQHKGYEDSNPDLIRQRLNRVKQIVSAEGNQWRQWILTHNCESAANYVSYGTMETRQGQVNVFTIAIAIAMNKGLGGLARGYYDRKTGQVFPIKNKNCMRGTCMDRNLTEEGCVCETEPQWSARYGKYCYVDGKICKGTRKHGKKSWGVVKGKKKLCLRKGDKKKYLNC